MSNSRTFSGLMIFAIVIFLSFSYLGRTVASTDYKALANATVSVVRMDGRSGGSGVIMLSSVEQSFVLTNNHVCGVATHGGWIIRDNGDRHAVLAFKRSQMHDLCMIRVAGDLHAQTVVAGQAPELYDEAVVAGHPALYPTIITKGHFTHIVQIQVIYGFRPCTEEEMNSSQALFCILNGGMPLVKTYDSQLTSATIMPGSSGSAVYNAAGELSGLIFAGAGQLGYGFAVPYAYVKNFLDIELKNLISEFPDQSLGDSDALESKQQNCNNTKDPDLQKLCGLVKLIREMQ